MTDLSHPLPLTARDRRAWEAGWRAGVEAAALVVENPERLARLRSRCDFKSEQTVQDQGRIVAAILETEAETLRALSPPATTTKEET